MGPSSPVSGVRAAMRGTAGAWGRDDGPQQAAAAPHAPAADPAVAGAAQEIERVEAELEKVEQEIATLRGMWRQQDAGRQTGFVAPQVLVERVYRENAQRSGLAVPPSPLPLRAAPVAEDGAAAPEQPLMDCEAGPTATDPARYEVFQENAARHAVLGPAIRAEIRRRKLRVYHRMRMTGERMGKLCEPEDAAPGQAPARVLRPGGVVRLQEMASPAYEGTARWDSSLAKEVDFVWQRDALRYVFDDQTQRVHDPEHENQERRATLRWTDEEQKAFVEAYKDYGKEFHVVATKKPFRVSEVAPKSTHEIIAFYYHIKHRIGLKQLTSKRGMPARSVRDRAALSSSAPPIPRELLNLGITSEAEVVAYLVAQNKAGAAAAAAAAVAPAQAAPGTPLGGSQGSSAPSSLSDVQVKREATAAEKRPREEEQQQQEERDESREQSQQSQPPQPSSEQQQQQERLEGLAKNETAAYGDEDDAESSGFAFVGDFVPPEVALEPDFDAAAHATTWSPLETALLLESVGEFGPDFEKLARDTGKSSAQCAAFYVQNEGLMHKAMRRAQAQRPADGGGAWSDEEKVTFRQCVMEHGRNWEQLLRALPGKTQEQCAALWNQFKWRLGLEDAFRSWQAEQAEQAARPAKALKSEDAVSAPAAARGAGEEMVTSPPLSARPFLAETQDASVLGALPGMAQPAAEKARGGEEVKKETL